MDFTPKVSIGLPVYNGENFLTQALDSIVNQSFSDFELIISDNASTDGTRDIIAEYEKRDSRIQYFLAKQNLGAAPNFNHVAKRAQGEYFKWAAHDDIFAPNYIEECVNILDNDPDVVLCHSVSYCIDSDGKKIGKYDSNHSFDQNSAASRFSELINRQHYCVFVFGLFRRKILLKTPLLQPYSTSDRNMLAEIGLLGKIHLIETPLFSRRDHPATSVSQFSQDEIGWINWFDPSAKIGIHTPTLTAFREYKKSIERTISDGDEKIKCLKVLDNWVNSGTDFKGRSVPELIKKEQTIEFEDKKKRALKMPSANKTSQ